MEFNQIRAGTSRDGALIALKDGSYQSSRAWVSSGYLAKIRPLLSDPITVNQAAAIQFFGTEVLPGKEFERWLHNQHLDVRHIVNEVLAKAMYRKLIYSLKIGDGVWITGDADGDDWGDPEGAFSYPVKGKVAVINVFEEMG